MIKGLIALGAAALACAPAAAQIAGCSDPDGCLMYTDYVAIDYTVPDDGRTYKWTFKTDQPNVELTLDSPNEVDFYGKRRTATGIEYLYGGEFPYRFDEIVRPETTTIFVRAPKGKPSTCDQPGPIGEVCWAYYRVWGNAANIQLKGLPDGLETIRIYATIEAVPEPATWATMILGFLLAGSMSRRSRLTKVEHGAATNIVEPSKGDSTC